MTAINRREWAADRANDRIRANLALQMVSVSTGVPVERMNRSVRLAGPACKARWLAIYLAHVTFGWPIERAGDAFGLNRSTAAAACRWAEDGRDHPVFDELLERLEQSAAALMEAPLCELGA